MIDSGNSYPTFLTITMGNVSARIEQDFDRSEVSDLISYTRLTLHGTCSQRLAPPWFRPAKY